MHRYREKTALEVASFLVDDAHFVSEVIGSRLDSDDVVVGELQRCAVHQDAASQTALVLVPPSSPEDVQKRHIVEKHHIPEVAPLGLRDYLVPRCRVTERAPAEFDPVDVSIR